MDVPDPIDEVPWPGLARALPEDRGAAGGPVLEDLARRVGRQLACFTSARLAAIPDDVRPYAPPEASAAPVDPGAETRRRAALAERGVLDPELLRFDPGWLAAPLAAWLARAGDAAAGPSALEELIARPRPGLVELPLVSDAFRARLLDELRAFEDWCARRGLPVRRPNSMNHAGAVLADAGLDPLLGWLRARVVSPLAARLLPGFGGASLDGHHGFSVAYGRGADRDLDLHVDDADVTLNVSLEREGDGAEVIFEGLRCLRHQQGPTGAGEAWAWRPRPGVALLHSGRLRHRVSPLRSGGRTHLIVWCTSRGARRMVAAAQGECPAWCRRARGAR